MIEFSSRDSFRLLLGVVGFAAAIGLIWVATQVGRADSRSQWEAAEVATLCRDALEKLVVESEQGIPVDDVEYDELDARCSAEYEVWTDFVSIKVDAESHCLSRCDELDHFGLEPSAIEFASQYGYCSN